MHLKIIIALFTLLFCLQIPVFAQALPEKQAFFEVLPALPLMEGLKEHKESTFIFDKPDGQIVEVEVSSATLSYENILDFYAASLPQLGWKKISKNQFAKKNEILIFVSENAQAQSPSGTTLKVILLPR
tara:strand:+ start:76 stop:462 length:387 start_codon:yes stop_codon:yes gene_type:complete